MKNFSDYNVEISNDVFIVTVELSRATRKEANELNDILSDAILKGWNKIIIEVDEVEFIDSTFLGVLVVNLKKVLASNGKFRLTGFQPSVHTVIEQTRLHRTFEIYESREEALKNI